MPKLENNKPEVQSYGFLLLAICILISYCIFKYYIPFFKMTYIHYQNEQSYYELKSEIHNYDVTYAFAYMIMNTIHWMVLIAAVALLIINTLNGNVSELIDPFLTKIFEWFDRRNRRIEIKKDYTRTIEKEKITNEKNGNQN